MQSQTVKDILRKFGQEAEPHKIFAVKFPGESGNGVATVESHLGDLSPEAIANYQRHFFRFLQHGISEPIDAHLVRSYDDHLRAFSFVGADDSYEVIMSTIEYSSIRAVQLIHGPLTMADIFTELL